MCFVRVSRTGPQLPSGPGVRIHGESPLLRIRRDCSLDDTEQGLEAVARGETDLQLPHSLKANAAGAELALVQLIITWARRAGPASRLRLHSASTDEGLQRAFARTLFGLAGLNLAQSVEDRSGDTLDRFALLTLAREFVVTMAERPVTELREFDKSAIPFVCIDNARNYRRPARLYVRGTDRVRDRADFASLVKSCAQLLPLSRRAGLGTILDAAASLLFEAFHNTHDHAQTDFRGDVLRRSIRGLIVGFQYVRLDALGAAGGDSPPLKAYYDAWQPSVPTAQHAQFLELGVFDSGPGLARRWLAAEPDLAERLPEGNDLQIEYSAVTSCLAKGATTKRDNTSGNGLFRIMQVVKRTGGFIRVRTGNMSLIRCFNGDSRQLTPGDLSLVDLTEPTGNPRRRAWAEGTTISVLLPMNRALTS